jgi:hypothetical protein
VQRERSSYRGDSDATTVQSLSSVQIRSHC